MTSPVPKTPPTSQTPPRRLTLWRRPAPKLYFAPRAWIKLQYLCHLGDTEVGGFGVLPDPKTLLVTDFLLVRQRCTAISVKFEDLAVADFFEQMVDQGLRPEQFARVWLHTHPGSSATPSAVDEDTFERVFGGCHWAVMFILARGGETYARLRCSTGPGLEVLLPTTVSWELPLGDLDPTEWSREYVEAVTPDTDPRWGFDAAPSAASTAAVLPATVSGEAIPVDDVDVNFWNQEDDHDYFV